MIMFTLAHTWMDISNWRLGHFKDAYYTSKPSLDISEAVLKRSFEQISFRRFLNANKAMPINLVGNRGKYAVMWKDVDIATSVVLPDGDWLFSSQKLFKSGPNT